MIIIIVAHFWCCCLVTVCNLNAAAILLELLLRQPLPYLHLSFLPRTQINASLYPPTAQLLPLLLSLYYYFLCFLSFNQAKPKTDVEARVYEVLSHKNWGAASSIMNQIARDTGDYEKFAIITKIMWESVETQRPSAWRVIFKGLTLVEHLVKNGSERCVDDARNHGHVLRQLHNFNYYEGTIDRGQGVREKSKQLVEILSDNERIREERQKARKLREKFNGRGATASGGGGGGGGGGYSNDGWNSGGGGGGGDDWNSGGGGGGGVGRDDWNSGGGGGGYGDGGIDSNRAARGRYDEDRPTSASSGPTFAQVPSTKKKTSKTGGKKVKKKKAPEAGAPAPAAGEIFVSILQQQPSLVVSSSSYHLTPYC